MKRAFSWSMPLAAITLLGAGIIFVWQIGARLDTLAVDGGRVQTAGPVSQAVTGTIPPVSAVGTIEFVTERQVVLLANGIIENVAVEVGDHVKRGDLLIALDTQQLEWAVTEADIGLENAQIALEQATEAIDESDIAVAEAALLSAQEQLALVEAGPTEEEMQAATSAAAAAWAAYNELRAGPTEAQLTQAQAALRQAEIDLQQAQRAYDRIAWQPEAGASSEGAALQRATIAYEAAKAAYEELTAPPMPSQLQAALSSAQSAQGALNQLKLKPTQAELAAARAEVASAEAALAKLREGVNAGDVRAAELGVQSAQIALEAAKRNLANASVFAPIDGVVVSVNVELGQQGSSGSVVATIADPSQLRLVANVEQKDINYIQVGQEAEITVYGLTGKVYHGVVELIAPQGESGTGSITFPVTLALNDESLADLKPGMNATATFIFGDTESSASENAAGEDSADENDAEESNSDASADE